MASKKVEGRIKLVVWREHTLGYIFPELPNTLCILHASVLKGAAFEVNPSSKYIRDNDPEVRLASKEDFDRFNCFFGSFGNEKVYEYKR
jgi:hypothetical protein